MGQTEHENILLVFSVAAIFVRIMYSCDKGKSILGSAQLICSFSGKDYSACGLSKPAVSHESFTQIN